MNSGNCFPLYIIWNFWNALNISINNFVILGICTKLYHKFCADLYVAISNNIFSKLLCYTKIFLLFATEAFYGTVLFIQGYFLKAVGFTGTVYTHINWGIYSCLFPGSSFYGFLANASLLEVYFEKTYGKKKSLLKTSSINSVVDFEWMKWWQLQK